MYIAASHIMWKRDFGQSIWSMPNIYAVDADGKIASGCRALEALKIIHDMHDLFQQVRLARERVQKGVLVSDLIKQREENPAPPLPSQFSRRAVLHAASHVNSVQPFAYRYQQEHGEPRLSAVVAKTICGACSRRSDFLLLILRLAFPSRKHRVEIRPAVQHHHDQVSGNEGKESAHRREMPQAREMKPTKEKCQP